MRTSRHRVREWYVLVLLLGLVTAWPTAGRAIARQPIDSPAPNARAAAQAGAATQAAPAGAATQAAPAGAATQAAPTPAPGQAAPAQEAVATGPVSSKTWIGHEAEFEEYLRTAPVVKIEDLPIGVTKPKRAIFDGNGPIKRAAWKPLAPGFHGGFYDSYKSEIAAYELDKMLDMHMIPPAVEREIKNDKGAIIQWVENIKSWKITDPIAGPDANAWNKQVVAMKMFDNLIGNIDPNLGNWLVDPSWNLILIDHSRALTGEKKLYHVLTRIDAELWEKMQALTEEQLKAAVGQWIGDGEIRALLERRKKMADEIDKLVKERGADAVFVK